MAEVHERCQNDKFATWSVFPSWVSENARVKCHPAWRDYHPRQTSSVIENGARLRRNRRVLKKIGEICHVQEGLLTKQSHSNTRSKATLSTNLPQKYQHKLKLRHTKDSRLTISSI